MLLGVVHASAPGLSIKLERTRTAVLYVQVVVLRLIGVGAATG